jgi:Ulp1 family protease
MYQVQVPFQTNGCDCGVYLLWQLRHILELGRVVNDMQALPVDLQVTGNISSKRLRLVQEILDDCNYRVFEQY